MNKLFPSPAGLNGVNPIIRSLDASSEDLSTVINPGFLNSVIAMGNQIDPKDLLLISYNNGTQIFQQSLSDGVITLVIYDPGNNGFPFINLQFVAKGGSNLSSGRFINEPKLTISAALSAGGAGCLVWVLDNGIYEENLVPPIGSTIYAPNATLTASSGAWLTVTDTGTSYGINVVCSLIQIPGTVVPYVINGASSNLYLTTTALSAGTAGSVVNGRLYLTATQYVSNDINVAASGHVIANVDQVISSTINITIGGTVDGNFGDLHYGTQVFNDKFVSHLISSNETVGRTLIADDAGEFIAYNSVSDDTYTLPTTSDAAIAIGTTIPFYELGTGKILFAAGAGATIISGVGALVRTTGAGVKATANKLSDTVWQIDGSIEAQP